MQYGYENVRIPPADFEGPSIFQLFRLDRRSSRFQYTTCTKPKLTGPSLHAPRKKQTKIWLKNPQIPTKRCHRNCRKEGDCKVQQRLPLEYRTQLHAKPEFKQLSHLRHQHDAEEPAAAAFTRMFRHSLPRSFREPKVVQRGATYSVYASSSTALHKFGLRETAAQCAAANTPVITRPQVSANSGTTKRRDRDNLRGDHK